MLKHATFFGAAIAVLLSTTAVSAQDATKDTVVATVGGHEITLGEMIITRAQLPQQYQQLPADVLFQGVLDQLIQQQLLADSLESTPSRVAIALKNQERTLKAGEAVDAIATQALSDDAIQAAYDAHIADSEAVTEYNASHILLETEEEAIAAKARIDAGAEFADVARELSTGPTGPNGGNLGWFSAGMMVPEFEEAVIALEPGQVSDPVQTQFGWHVMTLLETRVQDVPSLDDMREEIAGQLQEAAVTVALETLTEAADITRPEEGAFDPAVLADLSLLED